MNSTKLVFGLVFALILTGGILSNCGLFQSAEKQFSEADVSAVLEAVNGLDESTYYLVLPTFENGEIVGSATYGRLPVTQVKRLASSRELAYEENGNLQAIFQSCSGGGAGSHTESQSAGNDIGQRIEQILAHIDESAYIFLQE